ncbi:MAG: hypothetical protein R2911_42565 [Caldilineaceae bacterium]
MDQLALLQEEEPEFDDLGSFNHATVQGNLAYILKRIGKYTAPVELSLDSTSLDKSILRASEFWLRNGFSTARSAKNRAEFTRKSCANLRPLGGEI